MDIAEYSIEDMQVGMSERLQKTVDARAIKEFAALTSDFNPLHTDQDYARSCGFRDILAHGLLISSYSSALIGMRLPGKNAIVASQSFRYKSPAFPNDRLDIIGTVSRVEQRFSLIDVEIEILNQDNEIVAAGKYNVLLRKP